VGSNPTPRAKLLDSSEDFINKKQQPNIVKDLQEPLTIINATAQNKERKERLKKKLTLYAHIKSNL
jgi:hypothetical protein